MLQAIGEGLDLMRKGGNGFHLDLAAIFKNWSNGSVIRGWLVELMEKGLRDQKFENVQSYIEDSGEVNWLVQDALNKEIPIPVISQSRIKESNTYKAIALMRHGFGGHPFGND